CGAATRRYIAAGVEQRLRLQIPCRASGSHLHHGLLCPEREQQPAHHHQRAEPGRKHPQPLAGLAGAARTVIDLQRTEIMLWRRGSCAHKPWSIPVGAELTSAVTVIRDFALLLSEFGWSRHRKTRNRGAREAAEVSTRKGTVQ